MADKNDKVAENVDGTWYVDNNCISCGLCASEAPDVFKMNDDDMAYVYKQAPADDPAAVSAKDGCPVEAIGNDG